MSPTRQSSRTRLYIDASFTSGSDIDINAQQSHYLANVMRQKIGALVTVFNGRDGEWLAEISLITKKQVRLRLQEQIRAQSASPDVWLLAAPLRNSKTEKVLEQATELGISCFIPVLTRYTVADRVNPARLASAAMEAAEQSERLDLPDIKPLTPLADLLAHWDKERTLIYADESGASKQAKELSNELKNGSHYAVLIGPEGGFSPEELSLLAKLDYAVGMCMGPRILKADTAAIAAITLIQSWLGDWHHKPAFWAHE